MHNPSSLAIIPARCGSKRITRKNTRLFAGLPLIAYTIEAARASGLFAQVVVSTDCEETARIARDHGAEVPFLRPAHLADDHTPVSEATVDALSRVDPEGGRYEYVAQLMANCPLREADDVQRSFERFTRSGAGAQISIVDFGWTNPWWAMEMAEDGTLRSLFADKVLSRSQDLPPLFAPTGAVWWARASVLREQRTFLVSGVTGHPIAWDHGLDIDTAEDWRMGEFLLQHRAASERRT